MAFFAPISKKELLFYEYRKNHRRTAGRSPEEIRCPQTGRPRHYGPGAKRANAISLPPNISFASCIPISWACSGVVSPGSNACIKWRPRCVPLAMACLRVQANSISAVSAAQPKECDAAFSHFPVDVLIIRHLVPERAVSRRKQRTAKRLGFHLTR